MKLAIFDFDNTIISITDLHRQAWRATVEDVGLQGALQVYLPNTPLLMERFDSHARIARHFLQDPADRMKLEYYFDTTEPLEIAHELLRLKESRLLYMISQLKTSAVTSRLAKNLLIAFDLMHQRGHRLGIISSTRESVIVSLLEACNLYDAFEFIIGEESLYDEGLLHDKPLPFARCKIPSRLLKLDPSPVYIGDDVRIDSAFANRCGFAYIQADVQTDFLQLLSITERTRGGSA